jgi:hypothetical protein
MSDEISILESQLAALRGLFLVLLLQLEKSKSVDRAEFVAQCKTLLAEFDSEPTARHASAYLREMISTLTPRLKDKRERPRLQVISGVESPSSGNNHPRYRPRSVRGKPPKGDV